MFMHKPNEYTPRYLVCIVHILGLKIRHNEMSR